MVIKQQLQVANFAPSLGKSQAGNSVMAVWYNCQGQSEVT